MNEPIRDRNKHKKAARGRGNQGDWASINRLSPNITQAKWNEQQKHNAEIEAKKAAKKERKNAANKSK